MDKNAKDSGQHTSRLETGAVKAGKIKAGESTDISPRTKLPVEHPESQAVERIRYEMQVSLNSAPESRGQIESLLDGEKL